MNLLFCGMAVSALVVGGAMLPSQQETPPSSPHAPAVAIRPAHVEGEVVETTRQDLKAAVSLVARQPNAQNYLELARAYERAGVLDHAFDNYAAAAKLQPTNAMAWEAMARIWRDWGFPDRAVADGYRAAFFAPQDAGVQNTLGTVLQLTGQGAAARTHFERAILLDGSASYALNNLCYSYLVDRQAGLAETACRRALAIEPGLASARRNLAEAAVLRDSPERRKESPE